MIKSTKYGRTYHFPFSPGATSDDKISDDYSHLESNDVVGLEKLDGQNNCMTRGGVMPRSHAAYSELPWDKALWDIHKRVGSSISDNEYIFGENMYAIHSIEYSKLTSPYYIFGVRVNDEWLSWDDVEEYAYVLGLPTVPVLFKGKSDDLKGLVTNLVKEESRLGGFDIETKIKMMEGMVIRSYGAFSGDDFKKNLLKWVRANHIKTDVHWTRNWRKANIKY